MCCEFFCLINHAKISTAHVTVATDNIFREKYLKERDRDVLWPTQNIFQTFTCRLPES